MFVATRRIEVAADQWLLDRTALVIEAGHASRVTLAAEGGKKQVSAHAESAESRNSWSVLLVVSLLSAWSAASAGAAHMPTVATNTLSTILRTIVSLP